MTVEVLDLIKNLHTERRRLVEQSRALLHRVEADGSEFNGENRHQWEQMNSEINDLGVRIDEIVGMAEHDKEMASQREPFDRIVREDPNMQETESASRRHPSLLVSEANLRSHAEAIRDGSTFGAYEEHANVTVGTDTGSPGDWGVAAAGEPITLRAFAGIPRKDLNGATAQMPSLTLPAATAGVAESTAHGEYDTLDVANLTTLRYGRWTQVTSFVDRFTSLSAINQAHAIGIARDLNLVDITAIQTAAGTVAAFSASALDLNVRAAILKVAAAAVVPPEDVVLFGTSAAMAVVTGYAPANADDRGSLTVRVFGAKAYVTESAAAGNVYAFAPSAFQVFSTGLQSATLLDPTNGMNKFGSWLHSTGPGLFIVGGAAGVDVVTP